MQRLILNNTPQNAQDSGGNEYPIYIVDPPPQENRPPGYRATMICPECLDGKLDRHGEGEGGGDVTYTCANLKCRMKFKRLAGGMEKGILLVF